MSKKTKMTVEDVQAELSDALVAARELVEALEQVESCESAADLLANLTDAVCHATTCGREISGLRMDAAGRS